MLSSAPKVLLIWVFRSQVIFLILGKSCSETYLGNCASIFIHNFGEQGSCFWQELLLHCEKVILWGMQMVRGHHRDLQESTATALPGEWAPQNDARGIHLNLVFNFRMIFSVQGWFTCRTMPYSQSDPSSCGQELFMLRYKFLTMLRM